MPHGMVKNNIFKRTWYVRKERVWVISKEEQSNIGEGRKGKVRRGEKRRDREVYAPPHSSSFLNSTQMLSRVHSGNLPKAESWKLLSHVQLFATPWITQSMDFSRPEYWSGSSIPSLADLPNPGIEPGSPALQGDSLPTELWGKPWNHENFRSNGSVKKHVIRGLPGWSSGWESAFQCRRRKFDSFWRNKDPTCLETS